MSLSLPADALRKAEPGGPCGLREDLQVRGGGQPPPRGPVHQQVPVGAGRRHQCAALPTRPRALQKLAAHLPSAGLAQRGQQDADDGAGEARFPPLAAPAG